MILHIASIMEVSHLRIKSVIHTSQGRNTSSTTRPSGRVDRRRQVGDPAGV